MLSTKYHKYQIIFTCLVVVDCGAPPDIFPDDANTYWSLLSSSVTVSSTVVGTVYRYDCRPGYKNRLLPDLSYLGIECKADGQWQSCCNNDCIREYTRETHDVGTLASLEVTTWLKMVVPLHVQN